MVRWHRPPESSSFGHLPTLIASAISFFSTSSLQPIPIRSTCFKSITGAFHKAKTLVIPDNIILLFQPPYCPELNPIERLWQHLKKDLRWGLFKNLTQLQTQVDKLIAELVPETVASVTGFRFIVDALSVAEIF